LQPQEAGATPTACRDGGAFGPRSRPWQLHALAREQLKQHQPQRVEIGRRRERLPRELLRRHVRRRAGDLSVRTGACDGGRQAKVGQPHAAAPVDHDVRGLQIAMQHAPVVHGGQPGANLPRDFEPLVFGKAADASQQRLQIFAVHVLHRQKSPPWP
jgi:hypothetical protein